MHTKIENITIGADPEVFLRDKTTKEFISAVGIVPGDKHYPQPIGNGLAIQRDNVMGEFNVNPAKDYISLYKDINTCLDYINRLSPNIETFVQSSAFFKTEQLQSKEALEFGCDPDYCSWTQSMNRVSKKVNPYLRSVAGHIHIGYDNPSEDTSEMLVRIMDLFLGVPSIIIDTDTERRKLYGKAGAFRFQKHGIEYRVLGNFWIASEELTKWMFENTMAAIDWFNQGNRLTIEYNSDIVDCINNQDKEAAIKIIEKYGIKMPIFVNQVV